MVSFSTISNIGVGIIATIAMILAIQANNKKIPSIGSVKVTDETGAQIDYRDALKKYLSEEKGNKFMANFLKQEIGDQHIKDVMTKGMIKGVGYSMQDDKRKGYHTYQAFGGDNRIYGISAGRSATATGGASTAYKFVDHKPNW